MNDIRYKDMISIFLYDIFMIIYIYICIYIYMISISTRPSLDFMSISLWKVGPRWTKCQYLVFWFLSRFFSNASVARKKWPLSTKQLPGLELSFNPGCLHRINKHRHWPCTMARRATSTTRDAVTKPWKRLEKPQESASEVDIVHIYVTQQDPYLSCS